MDFKDFANGKIAIWCETQEEAGAVMRLCEENNLLHPAPEGWFFPESELPCELAMGYDHPYLVSFGAMYGIHHRVNSMKWKPVLAENFLKGGD